LESKEATRKVKILVKVSMHRLGAGKKAYLTTQLQNKVFTPEQAAEYAKKQWGDDVDVGSIEAYMKGEHDPLNPPSQVDVDELHETAISSALSKDLETVGEELALVKHQYPLKSGKFIDVLCKDEDNKWVAVEVKKSAWRDVVDQLLGYMRDLKIEHPEGEVRGVIMSNTYDEDLAGKVKLLKGSGIELRYYKLKVLPVAEDEVKHS